MLIIGLMWEGALLESNLLGLIPNLLDIKDTWIWSRLASVVVIFVLAAKEVWVRVCH
jgi:hypothetical protein